MAVKCARCAEPCEPVRFRMCPGCAEWISNVKPIQMVWRNCVECGTHMMLREDGDGVCFRCRHKVN